MVAVAAEREALSQNQIDAALLDPAVFIDRHCWIRGKGGVTERFNLWDCQLPVVHAMDNETRLLVLKARQLGISWCSDGYALWLCTANVGQTVLVLSKGLKEAQEELERIRFMHSRLPPELKRRLGAEVPSLRGRDTTTQIEFPDMDSRILSLASVEDAGTSFTATLVIIQELAKIKNAASLMAGVTPTIADGGRLFVVSTAKGYGGTFADLWRSVQDRWHSDQIVGDAGEPGEFRPVFIPWYARPGRDEAWRAETAKSLPVKTMRQEYPATPDEAWQGSADAVFAEEFVRGTHGVDLTRSEDSPYDVVHGVDPGVNHGLAYLIEVQGQQAFVFAEIHLQNKAVKHLGQAIAEEDESFDLDPASCMTYVDPAAAGRNMQTLETDYQVLAAQGLLVDEGTERYSPAQRVGLIKVLLAAGRLWISQDCPDLLDALERAPWAMRRAPGGVMVQEDTYAKDGVYEHPLDALGYALCRIFPPIEAVALETQASTAYEDQYAASGSEFG